MMVWRRIGRVLVVCGMLLVAFGASTLPAQGAEPAQLGAALLLQPSPRPTLAPTPRSRGDHKPATGVGRITGTIIDLSTGAPVPGVKVNVGGVVVVSDANGNYDLWVSAGPYTVALVLNPSEGTPAQAQQMVDVAPGATVVVHLSFRSPAAPTATPAAANSVAVPAATAEPAKPHPSRAGGGTAAVHAAPRLPRTGEQSSNSWAWITLGAMLLMGGIVLELGRKRLSMLMASAAARRASSYDNARLLASLLARGMQGAQPARARAVENDMLLTALLTVNRGETQVNEREKK
jgi:LPXTG-motif cell wall-anchored protein